MRSGFSVAVCVFVSAGTALAQSERTTFSDLLKEDAAGRSSLGSFGSSSVEAGGVTQFRFNVNSRDMVGAGEEDTATGFQSRRNTLWFTGSVDRFNYRVQGNFDFATGTFILEDAYFTHEVNENWTVGAGQLYFPVVWENFVTEWHQLAAERSVTDSVFGPGRVQGAWAQWASGRNRAFVAFHDGAATPNTDFTSGAEADYAFSGRFEHMWAGDDWSRFNDFTSFRGGGYAGKVGGAAHWQSGGSTTGTADVDVIMASLDAQAEGDGWNAFVQFIFRDIDVSGGTSFTDYGLVAQGGMFFSDNTEGFARYDAIFPDDDRGNIDDFHTITVGVNHYFTPGSHDAKFTADFQYFLTEQTMSIAPVSTATTLLASGDDSQFAFRGQMQLMLR